MHRFLRFASLAAAASFVLGGKPSGAGHSSPRKQRCMQVGGRAARLLAFAVVAMLLAQGALPPAALAQTFNPTDSASLIAAMTTANANNEDDVIDLGGGTFTLTAADNAGAFGGSNGLPIIGADDGHKLVIRNGTIRRDAAAPAFRIFQVGSGASLELETLTVTGGNPGAVPGGGIVNFGTLTLTGSIVSGNSAFQGGGIHTGGVATLIDSAVSGNSAPNFGGGGIFNQSGTLTVTNSTISGNLASFSAGGGIHNSAGTLLVTNSTLSGNEGGQGSGIFSLSNPSRVSLIHSTISGNPSPFSADINILGGTLSLRATILAADSDGVNCDIDDSATFTSVGSNVANDDSCFTGGANGDEVITAPATLGLGPLADNGGPTRTHALLAGSPALGAVVGPCTDDGTAGGSTVATDQRGLPRPGGLHCDAGAFELQSGTIQFSAAAYSTSESSATADITVTRTGGTAGAVAANITPSNGTASAPSDFNSAPIAVNFAHGESASKTVSVPIVNDALSEGPETANLALSSATSGDAIGALDMAVLTITDNDATGLSVNDVTVTEAGVGSTTTATFTVTLNPASAQTVSVVATTADGSATAPLDYVAKSTTLTFNPGETSKSFSVTVNGDQVIETDEKFLVNLSDADNATIADDQSVGTIRDNSVTGNIDPNNNGSGDKKDKDEKSKETKDERRNRERTNTGNRDETYVSGNVISWEPGPYADTLLVSVQSSPGGSPPILVLVTCEDGKCPTIRAGWELQADGVQHGQRDGDNWFWADPGVEIGPPGR